MAGPADVLLSDGSTVHIRPITSDDADRVVALHARFSDRTRYLRYFSPYPRIPPRDLARFVNVDHHDREALVAAVGDDLMAVGRYERLGPGAPDAEVAFVVEDAHQGRGVGSILLEHLAAAARDAGIERFVAEVLPENGPMLRVFADAGFEVSREYADGVVHLTFPIEPTPRSVEVQHRREQRTEAASIARLLAPRSVAVYGARADGTGVGAALLRHVVRGGFAGGVYPIHPTASTVDAWPAYVSAVDAPEPVDVALVAVPAARVAEVVEDAGRARAHALVVVSAGFAEAGDADAEAALVTLARSNGLRVVGPNCLGVVNTDPTVRLNASLASTVPDRGRVGVFCQSGALGVAVLAEAHERGVGLSTFVSAGNRADVSGNDLLQFWRYDPQTDVVLLYLETFGNPRKFARVARELGRDKPIVAVATGAAGLASPALFEHSGVIRVATVAELFDVGQVLASQPLPAGNRVAVLGNSPALVSLAVGACATSGLVPTPGPRIAPDASPLALHEAVRSVLQQDTVDTVFVVQAPPLPGAAPQPDEPSYVEAAAGGDKPVIVAFVGARPGAAGRVPVFATVEEAVRALARATAYATWRRQPVGRVPDLSDVDVGSARRVAAAGGSATELLGAYGVAVVPVHAASAEREAVAAARDLRYPVALKAADPDLRHRVDLGAVRLDLGDSKAVRAAYAEVSSRFGPSVLVQPMARHGVACVVEVLDDPAFGPVVGFGLGGLASDLLGDRAWRVAPLTAADAAGLVRAPGAAEMLRGYRGAPPVDLDALADLLLRVGRLADEVTDVKRLVLNPVLAHPDGLSVLHAEVGYGEAAPRPDTGPRRLR